jgi:hypothetical protein
VVETMLRLNGMTPPRISAARAALPVEAAGDLAGGVQHRLDGRSGEHRVVEDDPDLAHVRAAVVVRRRRVGDVGPTTLAMSSRYLVEPAFSQATGRD